MDNHWWHLEQTVDGARRRCGVTRCRTSWLVIFCSAKAIIVILRAVFWCYYYYYFQQHNTTWVLLEYQIIIILYAKQLIVRTYVY